MRSLISAVLVVFLAIPGIWEPARAGEKRAIAVLNLKARGLEEAVAENITDLVVKQVDRLGLFRTISMEEIMRMLEHEQQKILLGCDDTSCLAEIGGALGVELLVAGGVGKLGDTFVVSLKLIDVRRAKVLKREERTVSGAAEELVDVSRRATRALLSPIMKQESGTLAISCSEEGAEVYIDEVMVGTTPLSPRKVPGGYHAVRINKTRFVVFGRDVQIEPGKTTRLEVVLVPSRAFIEEYRAGATTYRTLAWTFTGIAVAAAGSATGLLVWNDGRLDQYQKDRDDFKLHPENHDPDELNERADSINLVDSATIGVLTGALLSGGVALYFWLAGDDPGRYDGLEPRTARALEINGWGGSGVAGATATFRF